MIKTIPFYQNLIGKGTITEVLLYGLIEVLSYEKGFCYASNKYLAEQLGIKENSLPVILANIKAKGWIRTEFDEKGKRQAIIPNLIIDDEGLIHIKGGFNEDLRGGLIHIKHILKKDNIVDNISNKDKSLLLIDETSETFGNEQINEAFELWEECFGIPQKNNAANRRAAYNLIRSKNKGIGWIRDSLEILKVAKQTEYTRKEVAGISNYADLQKYWEYLWQWGKSQAAINANRVVTDKI